ncbi:MAG: phosphotransferase [Tepidiformaceae bacterium]
MLNHESLEPTIPVVLGRWGITAPERVSPVPGGTLNWNFDVRTANSRFFLRCYRANLASERIDGEHRLVEWVGERGIPVAVPIAALDGERLLSVGEDRWSLFPWIDGVSIGRGALSRRQARALGAMHGRVQAVLATHPDSETAQFSMRWDKRQSLNALKRLVSVGKQRGVEVWIIEGMERQRRLLESTDVEPPEHFASLPCQLLHGDFHDQQVLFAGDGIRAVVDWEIWHSDPRAWELIRSLAFSQLLDSPLLEDYLAGYREHVQLSEGELQLALTLWFQSRLVGLWAWWAYLMEGNERVEEFFPSMLAELDLVTGERWTASIRSRVVKALCL